MFDSASSEEFGDDEDARRRKEGERDDTGVAHVLGEEFLEEQPCDHRGYCGDDEGCEESARRHIGNEEGPNQFHPLREVASQKRSERAGMKDDVESLLA